MANRKISALASQTNANLASGDLFHVVDISEADDADKNKSITVSELDLRYLNDLTDIDISTLTGKTTPVAADVFMLGDSAASFGNKKLTFANLESNLNHDSLTGFVANEHIDHTSVTLTAGEGLTGGGDISANRSFTLDFADLSNTATTVAATDLVSIYEATTNTRNEKITFSNFQGSITGTGALNSGSITSGFGNIDIGASTFDTTGAVNTGALGVTGDLTVDTNTLYVDSTNNRVGVGTASPTQLLDIEGSDPVIDVTNSDAANITNTTSLDFRLNSDSFERSYFKIETTSTTITDASRESTIDFKVNAAGSFVDALTITGTDIGIGQAPVVGSKLSLPLENDAATPTLSFGDGDTGLYESADDTLNVSIAGSSRFQFQGNAFQSENSTGGYLRNTAAADATPTIGPRRNDLDTGIGGGTTNELTFVTGGTEAIRIDSSQYVGVGVSSPTVRMDIEGETAAAAAAFQNTYYANDATAPLLINRKGRGTSSTPLAVNADDALIQLWGKGYDGSAFSGGANVAIQGYANQTFTGTNKGTYLTFSTTDDNSTTLDERMRIDDAGNVGIGNSSPQATFHVDSGTAGTDPTWNTNFDKMILEGSDNTNLVIFTPSTKVGQLTFADPSSRFQGGLRYDHTTDDMIFYTNVTEAFRISDDDKLSTGGETAPDVDAGGLCLYTAAATTGNIISLKCADVAHGITTQEETDTYGSFFKGQSTNGALAIRGLGESSIGMWQYAYTGSEETVDTSGSNGAFNFDAGLKSGTTVTTFGSTGNMFAVRNNGTCRFLVKGNGDLHATNTTITALDDENDLMLARDLQFASADKFKHKVSEQGMQKLKDVGAISSQGDFQVLQGMNAVTLGAISQLGNLIGFLADKLGIDKDQLLKEARNYNNTLTY